MCARTFDLNLEIRFEATGRRALARITAGRKSTGSCEPERDQDQHQLQLQIEIDLVFGVSTAHHSARGQLHPVEQPARCLIWPGRRTRTTTAAGEVGPQDSGRALV